jgi:hypothetical protein
VLKEARLHRRFPIKLFGTLELLDDGGHGTAFGICIIDVAPGGLGLSIGSGLPVGERVKLTVQGEVIVGVVVHCEKVGGQFTVGIAADHAVGALLRLGWIACLLPSAHPAVNRARAERHRT